MCDYSNADRAQWAAQAAHGHGSHPAACGNTKISPQAVDFSDIGDLVANLRHLCDALGIEWSRVLQNANMHYEAEVGEQALVDWMEGIEDPVMSFIGDPEHGELEIEFSVEDERPEERGPAVPIKVILCPTGLAVLTHDPDGSQISRISIVNHGGSLRLWGWPDGHPESEDPPPIDEFLMRKHEPAVAGKG